MSARVAARCLTALVLLGCTTSAQRDGGDRRAAPAPSGSPAVPGNLPPVPSAALLATPTRPAVAAPAPRPAPRAGAEISVPAGSVRLGSPTGSAWRNPAREADAVST